MIENGAGIAAIHSLNGDLLSGAQCRCDDSGSFWPALAVVDSCFMNSKLVLIRRVLQLIGGERGTQRSCSMHGWIESSGRDGSRPRISRLIGGETVEETVGFEARLELIAIQR